MGTKSLREESVSNNPFFRSISDKIDDYFGWKGNAKNTSKVRRYVHGSYHLLVGIIKFIILNKKGAKAEYKRAKDQFKVNKKIHHHWYFVRVFIFSKIKLFINIDKSSSISMIAKHNIWASIASRVLTTTMRTTTASTFITKLISTTTDHGVATCRSLNPKFTLGTLFKFGPFDKILKFLIILTEGIIDSILCTSLVDMKVASTIETIMSFAYRTSIVIEISIMAKNCCAICCRAPRDFIISIFNIEIKREFIIFYS